MNPRTYMDNDALHRYLWRKTNFRRVVTKLKTQIAQELGVSEGDLTRVLQVMEIDGRIKQTGSSHRLQELVVVDPAVWAETHQDYHPDHVAM